MQQTIMTIKLKAKLLKLAAVTFAGLLGYFYPATPASAQALPDVAQALPEVALTAPASDPPAAVSPPAAIDASPQPPLRVTFSDSPSLDWADQTIHASGQAMDAGRQAIDAVQWQLGDIPPAARGPLDHPLLDQHAPSIESFGDEPLADFVHPENSHHPYVLVNPEPNYTHLLTEEFALAKGDRALDPPPTAAEQRASLIRAGSPQVPSLSAERTYGSGAYRSYFVGGGVPPGRRGVLLRGDARRDDEGIWAVDYAPSYSRVALRWSHGRLHQGGTGQYEPDEKNRPFGHTFGRHAGNHDQPTH